jgi:serine/threonine-protein kinase RsbW
MNEEFRMEVPSEPQYVSVARLAIGGLASHAAMSAEDIEDIKVCLSEACNSIIQNPEARPEQQIDIRCLITDDGLTLKVQAPTAALDKRMWSKENGMGKMFVERFMDEVKYSRSWAGNSAIKMVKHFPEKGKELLH